VGFCLEDSEHPPSSPFGPSTAVYGEAVRQGFCQQFRPQATSLREGISRGWRDRYLSNLAFQDVDVSNTPPGEYWLREDVNPDGTIKEEVRASRQPAYSKEMITLPGFDAQPQALITPASISLPVTLKALEYGSHGEAEYKIVSEPTHGTLTGVGKARTYIPQAGYNGPDQFTFLVRDKSDEFPRSAVIATVSIMVGEVHKPTLAITSAPESMTAGTSAQLSAQSANYSGAVEWTVSAGSVSPAQGQSTTFAAPSTPGPVSVTARLTGEPSVTATGTIQIAAAPSPVPASEPPPAKNEVAGEKTYKPPYLLRPRGMLVGKQLVMTTTPELAGTVRLSAYLGARRLGTCHVRTLAGRRFVCRVTLASARVARSRITIIASLRANAHVYVYKLRPAVIARMRMVPAGTLHGARAAGYGVFWCSPSTLIETLEGGSEE
jgi:hypothetical protein